MPPVDAPSAQPPESTRRLNRFPSCNVCWATRRLALGMGYVFDVSQTDGLHLCPRFPSGEVWSGARN